MTHLERVHLSDEQSKLAYVDQINQGNSHNDYGTQQYNTIKFNTWKCIQSLMSHQLRNELATSLKFLKTATKQKRI